MIRKLITFLIIAGLGIWLWEDVLEDRWTAKRFGIVEPGRIYRSGQISHWMIQETLEKHRIQTIIDLTTFEMKNPDQLEEAKVAKEMKIEHFRYPLKGDGTGDVQQYVKALQKLHLKSSEGTPVLVHCAAGAQRTGGVIAMYRVLIQQRTPEFALQELSRFGWKAEKDRILIDYLNRNMKDMAHQLHELGVLSENPNPLPFFEI